MKSLLRFRESPSIPLGFLLIDLDDRLAVNYMFLTNDGSGETRELVVEPFDAVTEQNDYEVRSSFHYTLDSGTQ